MNAGQMSLQLISPEPLDPKDTKLVAKELWGIVNFLIIDLFHSTYEPTTAHLQSANDLPVLTVRLSKKKETAKFEGLPIESRVNQQLRELHDHEGPGSEPPFLVDHTHGNVPTYPNPRSAIRSSSSSS
ncbi:hypothetical protein K402DRAFT_459405 [Aulographum hederae CBS 113979]|uniref:Uncharacterized protein n=1 Tax=Aulographum hederae CBS 113979 TaxID=1176131 RepID=A0A6G1HEM4_9PEZI|nr:hypothetical protein K402DRAFT_459405 [Aulographum hederae CBS 113979]